MAFFDDEENHSICKKKLILAEGKDDCLFLNRLLIKENDIQIRNFNGKDNLTNEIEALKRIDGFDDVTSILVFRDSEESSEIACDSINYSLRKTGLIITSIEPFIMNNQNNRKIGFTLFPGKDENGKLYNSGTLEHLCIKIFKGKSVKSIVRTYIEDFQSKKEKFKKLHKNELHALFSFTDDYVGNKIGDTARDGGFDFNSPYLFPFLEMIRKM